MIWFKACPRCMTGDLVLSEDMYGKYQQCFQCGHVVYPREEITLSQEAGKAAKKQHIAACHGTGKSGQSWTG